MRRLYRRMARSLPASRFRAEIKRILRQTRKINSEIASYGRFCNVGITGSKQWQTRIETWITEMQKYLIRFAANLRFVAEMVGGESLATIERFSDEDDFLIDLS